MKSVLKSVLLYVEPKVNLYYVEEKNTPMSVR